MASAATAADVGDLLGSVLDGEPSARAERLLGMAEGIISSHVPGITYQADPFTDLEFPAVRSRTLILPQRPITAISSVAISDVTLDPYQYRYTQRGELILTEDLDWGDPDQVVTVSGTFGPTEADVRFVAADLVRQTFSNPAGLRMEVIGGRTAQFDGDLRPMTLTSAHRRILKRYRVTASALTMR